MPQKLLSKNVKPICLIFFVLLVVMLLRRTEINQALEPYLPVDGVIQEFPFEQQPQFPVALMEGTTLSWNIILEGRVTKIGVKFGTYLRQNNSVYEMILYSKSGLLLEKKTIYADKLQDNQYAWLEINRSVLKGEEYRLQINSVHVPEGNEIAVYTINHASLEKIQSLEKQNLALGFEYEKVTEMSRYFPFILWGVFFVFCLFGKNICKELWKDLKSFTKLIVRYKIIICSCILVIGSILILLFLTVLKKEDRTLIYTIPDSGTVTVEELVNGQEYRQVLKENGWNTIGWKFATYTEQLDAGTVQITLYQGEEVLETQYMDARTIRDNRYLYVKFRTEQIDFNKELSAGIKVELPEGKHCGIYRNEDGFLYRLALSVKQIRWFELLIVLAVLFALTCILMEEKKPDKKRWFRLLLFIEAGVLCGICFYSYQVYQTITPNTLKKIIGLGNQNIKKFSIMEENYERIELKDYSLDGTVNNRYVQHMISDINSKIDTLTLFLEPETVPKVQQTVRIYYELDLGLREKQKVDYQFLYHGQESITIPFSYIGDVKALRIDFGISNSLAMEPSPIFYLKEISVNQEQNTSQWEIVIFIFAFSLIAIFMWIYREYNWNTFLQQFIKKHKWKPEVVFLLLSLIIGITMALVIPVMQIPDEGAHMQMSLGVNKSLEKEVESSVSGVMSYAGNHVNSEEYQKLLNLSASDIYQFSISSKSFNYPGVLAGTLIAKLFQLPVFWLFTLAELGALLLYSIIGYFTIRKMPFHKVTMMAILLLPMAMQQAGSWSYDSFNNAVAFYLIAYIFSLKYEKKTIGNWQLLKVILLSFILLYIKKVYVILSLLLFMIPAKQFRLRIGHRDWELDKLVRKKSFWIASVITCCAGGIASYFILSGMDLGKGLLSLMGQPEKLCVLLGKSVIQWFEFYVHGILGFFGWFDFQMDTFFYWGTILLLLFIVLRGSFGEVPKREQITKERMILGGIFMVGSVLICLSMFQWTLLVQGIDTINAAEIDYINWIEGVQGRYFLPFLPLLFLMPKGTKTTSNYRMLLLLLYFIGVPIVVIGNLLNRYWG